MFILVSVESLPGERFAVDGLRSPINSALNIQHPPGHGSKWDCEYKSVNRNKCTICSEDCQGSALSKRALAHNGDDRFDEEKVSNVISANWQERGQSSESRPFLSFGT